MIGQIAILARRGVTAGFLRQPANAFPSILFPLLFMAFTVAGAGRAADIPGFPAQGYLEFLLPAALLQGTMLLGINAGSGLALDIEEGFIRRLLLTPMHRMAMVFGHIGAVAVAGGITGTLILVVGWIFGAQIATGFFGALTVVALGTLVALAFGSIGAFIGARTGSAEATQTVFPLFFVVMVFSSFFMPLEFIDVTWFRGVARANPATYIIDAMRAPITTGWEGGTIALGLLVIVAVTFVGLSGAVRALQNRIEEIA